MNAAMKKKILFSVLMSALLMMSFVMSACGDEPAAAADTSAAQKADPAGQPGETEPPETTLIDTLPSDLDFEGYEIRLVTPAIL